MAPAILDRRVVYKGYLTVERLRIRLPDQAVVTREIESHGDAIAILPYDPDEIVLQCVDRSHSQA
jgi:hypothetical protein